MNRIIRNIISFISFTLLIFIFVNKYLNKVKIGNAINYAEDLYISKESQMQINIKLDNADIAKTRSLVEEMEFFNIDKSVDDYEKKVKALNILRTSLGNSYDIHNYKKSNILKEMYDIVYRHITKNWKRTSDPEYFKEITDALQSARFLGDSMVSVMEAYNRFININDRFHTFKGTNIRTQLNMIDSSLVSDVSNLICFNGCNIKYFIDADDYISAYYDIINKIKLFNPEIKIFISSLHCPSRKALEKDEGRLNLSNASIFDNALEEEFRNNEEATYIDTKWIAEEEYYDRDGIHFKHEYYYTYIPYVLKFIEYIN